MNMLLGVLILMLSACSYASKAADINQRWEGFVGEMYKSTTDTTFSLQKNVDTTLFLTNNKKKDSKKEDFASCIMELGSTDPDLCACVAASLKVNSKDCGKLDLGSKNVQAGRQCLVLEAAIDYARSDSAFIKKKHRKVFERTLALLQEVFPQQSHKEEVLVASETAENQDKPEELYLDEKAEKLPVKKTLAPTEGSCQPPTVEPADVYQKQNSHGSDSGSDDQDAANYDPTSDSPKSSDHGGNTALPLATENGNQVGSPNPGNNNTAAKGNGAKSQAKANAPVSVPSNGSSYATIAALGAAGGAVLIGGFLYLRRKKSDAQ